MAPGTYSATASSKFYSSQTADGLVVTDGQTTTQDFVLNANNPPPTVVTQGGFATSATTATLSLTVNPNGQATTFNFQYGLTTSYGSTTSSFSAGSGTSDLGFSVGVGGLACSSVYHFRATATNASGTSF